MREPAGNVYDNPFSCQLERSKLKVLELLYSSTYSAPEIGGLYMISFMTTCPTGEVPFEL